MDDKIKTAEDDMAADEQDDGQTPSSIESTPEAEIRADVSQEPTQPLKRKGGRKPIYATSEERKQRNRQAQAAFRERRTEYIKQLEATIKQNEETLSTLQQSHRTAADECLMLRYKNSLLERILLEKGVDVQAELNIKTGSPVLGTGFARSAASAPIAQASQPQLQRTALQRQHARRSGSQQVLPKIAPTQSNTNVHFPTASPQGVPTPSSHASSPTNLSTRSPMALQQGGITPPTSAVFAQPPPQQSQTYPRSSQSQLQHNQAFVSALQQQSPYTQQRRLPLPLHQYQRGSVSALSSNSTGSQYSMNASPLINGPSQSVGPLASAYYPSPYQKHMDNLEPEYDIEPPRSTLDHSDQDPSSATLQGYPVHGQPPNFDAKSQHEYYQHQQQQLPPQAGYPHAQFPLSAHPGDGIIEPFEVMGQLIDPNDPMLDADPFGLSASMHYPTSYSVMEQQQPSQH